MNTNKCTVCGQFIKRGLYSEALHFNTEHIDYPPLTYDMLDKVIKDMQKAREKRGQHTNDNGITYIGNDLYQIETNKLKIITGKGGVDDFVNALKRKPKHIINIKKLKNV